MLWTSLLVFSISLVHSQALQCYHTISPSTNYKPQSYDMSQCLGDAFMCYKYVINQEQQGYNKGVYYGCANQEMVAQRPGASAPECSKKDKNIYCLCSGDLCNSVGGFSGAFAVMFLLLAYSFNKMIGC